MSLPMKFKTFETLPDLSRDTPLENVSESSAIFDFEKVRQLPNQITFWSSESAVYEQLELLGKGNQSKVMKIKEDLGETKVQRKVKVQAGAAVTTRKAMLMVIKYLLL